MYHCGEWKKRHGWQASHSPQLPSLGKADGSTKSPCGIVEDVLVRVGRVHVMTDFVVMPNPDNFQGARYDTVLLGRPFVETMGLLI